MNAHQRRKKRRNTTYFIMDIESFSPFDIQAFRNGQHVTTIFHKPGDPFDTYISALTESPVKEAA